jgi:hypothetical protein
MQTHTIRAWCEQRPELFNFFKALNQAHVKWALFSGMAVRLLANGRDSTDIDLLVGGNDFDQVCELLPRAIRTTKAVMIKSADGARITYDADEVCAWVDDTEVQVMRSPNGMNCGEHVYELELSDLAAANRLKYVVAGESIYLAHPFDTVATKAIMQRGLEQRKFDLADARALLAQCASASSYMARRAAEMHLDERVFRFLQRDGLAESGTSATMLAAYA